jgi:hypothetical protein
MKAWNSYSIGGIVVLRCLKKPENKMSRLWGLEIPARPAAVTKDPGGPSASAVRPPPRHSEEDASRRSYVTQESKFRQKFSPPDQYSLLSSLLSLDG